MPHFGFNMFAYEGIQGDTDDFIFWGEEWHESER
jgi:hypothetical protein